jgi:multisubunit Na+/H+ antiporter MnhG subunit
VTHARHIAAVVLLVGGVAIEVVAVLGVVVMRDALDRLHYVGLAGFGALLVGGAIMLRAGFSLIGDKAVLTGVVLVALSPVLVHASARSLRIRAHGDWREGIDEHREDEPR